MRDIDKLLDLSKSVKFNDNKLFVSVGEHEDEKEYKQPIKSLINSLEQKEDFSFKFVEFNGGSHYTCPSEALTYGMKYFFENHD
jgi:hypothetical protein